MTQQRDPAPFGTVEAAREYVADLVGGILAHAQVVSIYAETGDDAGLIYAGKCTSAYLRALEAGIQELERSRAVVAYRRSAQAVSMVEEA